MRHTVVVLLLLLVLLVLAGLRYGIGLADDTVQSVTNAEALVLAPSAPLSTAKQSDYSPAANVSETGRASAAQASRNFVTPEEWQVVIKAMQQPDGLELLKEMAEAGSAPAALQTGTMLLACSPKGQELSRYRIGKAEHQLAEIENRLLGNGELEPVSTSSVENLSSRIISLEMFLKSLQSDLRPCARPEYAQPWSGFDWIARAIDMGLEKARLSYVAQVVKFFGVPSQVARYPQRATVLRNRARTYLEQIKAECTSESLRDYAAWSVALYPYNIEQRYVAVFSWLRLQQQLLGEDSAVRWGERQEAALKNMITPEQQQRAEARIDAMLARCGDS